MYIIYLVLCFFRLLKDLLTYLLTSCVLIMCVLYDHGPWAANSMDICLTDNASALPNKLFEKLTVKHWVTSLFGLVRAFWLSPNTNLNAPLWSKSRPEISSAEVLLKIVKMASLADRHMSSVDVQLYRCLFTARLRPLRLGIISAATAAAAIAL